MKNSDNPKVKYCFFDPTFNRITESWSEEHHEKYATNTKSETNLKLIRYQCVNDENFEIPKSQLNESK